MSKSSKEYNSTYYEKNKEALREKHREYAKSERGKENARAWRKSERGKAMERAYKLANREKHNARRRELHIQEQLENCEAVTGTAGIMDAEES